MIRRRDRVAKRLTIALAAALALVSLSRPAAAQKSYDPGVTDTEIKLGQTMPFSGPLSAYSTVGRAMAAYFAKVNAEGGVNGRKITLISLDDGFSPPKTVEQTRKLVEQDGVFLIFASLGTATNAAVQKYLTEKKVPQLFIQSGASRWNDPEHFPWSVPGLPNYVAEARAYAQYILATKPDARIAVLYQNDDFGKDYLRGFRGALGERAGEMIVGEQSYDVTDPTIDSQIISLSGTGADTFLSASTQKATSQAIRKADEVGWHPQVFLSAIASSIKSVLIPAGVERAVGIISAAFTKDPTDPQWQKDADYQAWAAWMKEYYPDGNPTEQLNAAGYWTAALMTEVLRRCGDTLTRDNVMAQVTHIEDMALPMLLPGITVSISPENYLLFKRTQLVRFDGTRWVPLGKPIGE
ncbi:MAG TPA: ABC transporter substrate-binding protein [Stellaceae bacterium]|nr:ABC transporter substrate-binding protein [Stellaceae bacterium]